MLVAGSLGKLLSRASRWPADPPDCHVECFHPGGVQARLTLWRWLSHLTSLTCRLFTCMFGWLSSWQGSCEDQSHVKSHVECRRHSTRARLPLSEDLLDNLGRKSRYRISFLQRNGSKKCVSMCVLAGVGEGCACVPIVWMTVCVGGVGYGEIKS